MCTHQKTPKCWVKYRSRLRREETGEKLTESKQQQDKQRWSVSLSPPFQISGTDPVVY